MNGRKARALRKLAYGDQSLRLRVYEYATHTKPVAGKPGAFTRSATRRAVGPRIAYRLAKKVYTRPCA